MWHLMEQIRNGSLMFVTAASMCKLVKGEEFDVAKRTIDVHQVKPGGLPDLCWSCR